MPRRGQRVRAWEINKLKIKKKKTVNKPARPRTEEDVELRVLGGQVVGDLDLRVGDGAEDKDDETLARARVGHTSAGRRARRAALGILLGPVAAP